MNSRPLRLFRNWASRDLASSNGTTLGAARPLSACGWRPRGEEGNAIVEFVGIMVVIIVPALVLLAGLATTTSARLGLEDAARQSVRAYIRADSAAAGEQKGRSAATEAWENRGFDEPLHLVFTCSARPCLTPGESVTARASTVIAVPVVGRLTVSGEQTMVVDQYRVVRP